MSPMPRRKLRLINPCSPLSTITMPEVIRKMTFSRRALFMPLNLAICAAVVPEGWDAEIIDENTLDELHQPSAEGVDAVGIGAMTTQVTRAYELADAYRALRVPVIMGGIHASALSDEALQHADVVCIGDAENTLPRALEDLLAGQARRTYNWRDYPEAPIVTPRKDLLDPKEYLVFNPIQTTRGCPHDCTFCTTPAIFGRKYRLREIGSIVEEIREAKERFGSSVFIFSDDNVAGNHKWAMELFEAIRPLNVRWVSQCDILIARNPKLLKAMRDSGCEGVLIGLESPRAGTLAEMGKRYVNADEYLREVRRIMGAGIGIWGSFIFGFDTDDWQDCMNAVRFAQKAELCMSCYTILTPYPGTQVFAQYEAEGRLRTRDWTQYNGASVVFEPARMTVDELRHAQVAAFNEFYRPSSVLRRLKLWPVRTKSWMANLAIHRGLTYYYNSRNRPLPYFRDFLDPDAGRVIARSLGERRGAICPT